MPAATTPSPRRAAAPLAACALACGAVAVVPGALGRASALGAGRTRAAASVPAVMNCAGKAVVKPAQYVLACADANAGFLGLHWTSWTASVATATGTYRANDCTPTCVAGHFHNYPGTLRLSKPKRTSAGELFSEATYSYTTTLSQSLPTRPLS
jgi:hypothetical protein